MSMENLKVPTTLDVTIYGNQEQINDTLSKSRVRIFYKGMNRNRTFISEDFANQLISSLPYTPIKGIFNKDTIDYEDHGENNSDGRIYGIVPAETNFAWEKHLDIDGEEREYACCDVFLFTGLYPEAKLIPGESQSMEIFRNTLEGEWRLSESDKMPYYYFLKGSLVGLQVLGQEVEPCFEGAAFYGLNKDIQLIVEYIKKFNEKKEERIIMDKSKFRISDSEKADILFDLINPNFNEEGNWALNCIIIDVYEDYALCGNPSGYQRVYYTKDGDNITIGESVAVKIVDVTENEYSALEAMKSIGGSFEEINTAYSQIKEENETLKREKAEFQTRIADFENSKTTLGEETNTNEEEVIEESEKITEESQNISEETETNYSAQIEALEAEKAEIQKQLFDIKNENESLMAFKKEIEKSQKEAILLKYEEYLSESIIAELQEKIDDYSVNDFKKEVCTAAVESDLDFFSKKKEQSDFIYKGGEDITKENNVSPAVRILNKYKNGGNK